MSRSPQTLSEADRRLVAAWAADCVERVLPLFEAEAPNDDRPRALIARTRAFARGELRTAEEIRRRFAGGVGAGDAPEPAAAAAARAAGQAVAVCHMGAHALGAAAYAARAVGLANRDRPAAVDDEIAWQLRHMSTEVRAALRRLPPVGENPSGPLGPGLLASGELGAIIRKLQAGLGEGAAVDDFGDQCVRLELPVREGGRPLLSDGAGPLRVARNRDATDGEGRSRCHELVEAVEIAVVPGGDEGADDVCDCPGDRLHQPAVGG